MTKQELEELGLYSESGYDHYWNDQDTHLYFNRESMTLKTLMEYLFNTGFKRGQECGEAQKSREIIQALGIEDLIEQKTNRSRNDY